MKTVLYRVTSTHKVTGERRTLLHFDLLSEEDRYCAYMATHNKDETFEHHAIETDRYRQPKPVSVKTILEWAKE